MSTVLQRLPTGARVAVIRLRSLGDCVLTTPALALLKNARPDLRIAIVVEGGFAHFRLPALYNVRIPRAQQILGVDRKVHTAEHLASAMFYLGVPPAEIPRARLYAEQRSRSGPYAVIHPLASAADKRWTPGGFRAVAEHLRNQGIEPVFIC